MKWTQEHFLNAHFRACWPKVSVQKVLLCPFYCRPRTSGASLESPGIFSTPGDSELTPDGISFQLTGHRQKERTLSFEPVGRNIAPLHFKTENVGETGYSFSLKVKWGYTSTQKLESERSKKCAVSISLQTKAISS